MILISMPVVSAINSFQTEEFFQSSPDNNTSDIFKIASWSEKKFAVDIVPLNTKSYLAVECVTVANWFLICRSRWWGIGMIPRLLCWTGAFMWSPLRQSSSWIWTLLNRNGCGDPRWLRREPTQLRLLIKVDISFFVCLRAVDKTIVSIA